MLSAPLAGRLSDGIGPLPIMQWSLIGTGVLLIAFPFVHTFGAVIALTLAWSLVAESFRPANMACIADIVPPELRKPAYALFRLAINLGMSVGPAAAGFIAAQSFTWIFITDAVTTLAAGALLIAYPVGAVKRAAVVQSRAAAGASNAQGPSMLEDRGLFFFLIAIFLTGFVFFQHEGALPLFLVNDLGLSPAFYGMLFTVNTVMIVFMEVPLNAATAHWAHRRALALGALLYAFGSAAFAVAAGPAAVFAGIVIWTVGEMLLFPQAAAYVSEIAPESRRGEYMGAYTLAFNVAFAVGPWAGTAALGAFGARPTWLGVFVIGAISASMMMRVSTPQTEAATVSA